MTETLNSYEETSQTGGDAQQAHDQAMLAKAEQLEAANRGERPEWLPSKFDSPEAMAQAYAALERKLGSSSEEQTQETNYQAEEADADTGSVEEMENRAEQQTSEVAKALDAAGLDFSTFQDEYEETGGLSEEAYDALSEAGFPKSLVDSWIAGQEALAASVQSSVFNMVGGQDAYAEMVGWAADNLPQSEINAFNANVESGDAALTQFAVQGLYARYRSERTTEPTLIQGEVSNNQGGAFNSVAELTAAMRDPRYHKDPAYRQSVSEKLARSNVF